MVTLCEDHRLVLANKASGQVLARLDISADPKQIILPSRLDLVKASDERVFVVGVCKGQLRPCEVLAFARRLRTDLLSSPSR